MTELLIYLYGMRLMPSGEEKLWNQQYCAVRQKLHFEKLLCTDHTFAFLYWIVHLHVCTTKLCIVPGIFVFENLNVAQVVYDHFRQGGNQTIRPKFRKGSHCIPARHGGKETVRIRGIWWSYMTNGHPKRYNSSLPALKPLKPLIALGAKEKIFFLHLDSTE